MRHADVVQAEREYVLPGSHIDLVFIWAQQKGWIVIHTIHRELSHWSSFCIWTHTQAKYYFKYAASVQNKKRTKKLVIRQSFRFHTYTLNLRGQILTVYSKFILHSSHGMHLQNIKNLAHKPTLYNMSVCMTRRFSWQSTEVTNISVYL